MGEAFDLATVAGMAGLGGSAVAAVVAALVFKGLVLRIVTQVVVTTLLTVAGFVMLLGVLGFEIVPKGEELDGAPRAEMRAPPGMSLDDGTFTTQSVPSATPSAAPTPEGTEGKRVIRVRSPFRKG